MPGTNIKKIPYALLLLYLFFTCCLYDDLKAEESAFKAGGYIKHFFQVFDIPDVDGLPQTENHDSASLTKDRLRLNLSYKPHESVFTEFSYEIIPSIYKGLEISDNPVFPKHDPFSFRIIDIPENIYPEKIGENENFILAQNIDRMIVALSLSFCDIYLGRQPVAFGSARTINPTDIFTPFSIEEIDREDRIGIDALRIKIPLGDMSEIDLGLITGEKFIRNESAVFTRFKYYLLETDFTLLATAFKNNMLIGIDIARSIGDACFWLESTYTFADLLNNYTLKENYFRSSAGLDYNFSTGVYIFLEYHYNGAGKSKPEDYLMILETTAYTDGAVFLLGRNYIIPGIRYEISPLIIFNGQVIFNVDDQSSYSALRLQYNILEDVYLEGGIYKTFGRNSKFMFDNGIPTFRPEQEFGLYPDIYFFSMKIYF